MSKNADHADLIEQLRYPDDSMAMRLEAADLIEWQARELRHLARRIGEVETELKKAKELLGGFEWKRAEIKKAKELSGGFEWKRVENGANRK